MENMGQDDDLLDAMIQRVMVGSDRVIIIGQVYC